MTAALAKTKTRKAANASARTPQLTLEPSPQFVQWLSGLNTSLCLTTYQAGKIFMIGSTESDRLSVFERTLNRCMGLAATPRMAPLHVNASPISRIDRYPLMSAL